jgi:hypothetical protein
MKTYVQALVKTASESCFEVLLLARVQLEMEELVQSCLDAIVETYESTGIEDLVDSWMIARASRAHYDLKALLYSVRKARAETLLLLMLHWMLQALLKAMVLLESC